MPLIRRLLQIALPLLVAGAFIASGLHLMRTAPEQQRRSPPPSPSVIEVLPLKPQQYQVRLRSNGRVQAATKTAVSAEVTGRVITVSPKFFVGGHVSKDELLIEIDAEDYQQAMVIVRAELAQARLALEQGEAERDQVLRDRKLLGLTGKPSKFALREPQIKSNQAAVAAANARLAQARTALARTKIIAPYDGRITAKQAEIGQYLNAGATLFEIVALDQAEVRLPLTDRQLAYLVLPDADSPDFASSEKPRVTIEVKTGHKTALWEAQIVRNEGVVDAQSLQQYVVAQIQDPFVSNEQGRPPLALGQFVTAQIDASLLEDVWVIPRTAIRNDNMVQFISSENVLSPKQVSPVWADDFNVVVAQDPALPARIAKTPIALAADGMTVSIAGASTADQQVANNANIEQALPALLKPLSEAQRAAFNALPEAKKLAVVNLPKEKQDAFFKTL